MMIRTLAIVLCAVVLAGCASAIHPIYLQHPDGRRAQCDAPAGSDSFFALRVAHAHVVQRECVRDYQRGGYERVSD